MVNDPSSRIQVFCRPWSRLNCVRYERSVTSDENKAISWCVSLTGFALLILFIISLEINLPTKSSFANDPDAS